MKTYTVHARQREEAPVLVREGFSWGALLFGPLWLLVHRAWIPAVVTLMLFALIALVPPPGRGIPMAGAMVLLGLVGRDLQRWSLYRRGYDLDAVVVARTEDTAFLRYMDAGVPV